jgi:hypothetical protein
MAPTVVVVSNSSHNFMFDLPSLTYEDDAPTEDATMATKLTAAASSAGKPKATVRKGTKMMPPPNPNIAPTIPAKIPTPINANIMIGSI